MEEFSAKKDENTTMSDPEKDERIIEDYVNRGQTLQRNYFVVIALALGFLLLYSFPHFSAEQYLMDLTSSQNSLNDVKNLLSTVKTESLPSDIANNISNVPEKITKVQKFINETKFTLSIDSPLGTIKVGFIQILIFYPLALSIGFAVLCSQLMELLRYGKWVNNDRTDLGNELYHRSPGVIRPDYGHHVFIFLLIPTVMLISSIVLDVYAICCQNDSELRRLYEISGFMYQISIITIYLISIFSVGLFTYFAIREFKDWQNSYKNVKKLKAQVDKAQADNGRQGQEKQIRRFWTNGTIILMIVTIVSVIIAVLCVTQFFLF